MYAIKIHDWNGREPKDYMHPEIFEELDDAHKAMRKLANKEARSCAGCRSYKEERYAWVDGPDGCTFMEYRIYKLTTY